MHRTRIGLLNEQVTWEAEGLTHLVSSNELGLSEVSNVLAMSNQSRFKKTKVKNFASYLFDLSQSLLFGSGVRGVVGAHPYQH